MSNSSEKKEKELSFIPNPAGIPIQGKNSESIRKAHNRWKKSVRKKKKTTSFKHLRYWQVMLSK